ncbi:MAG: hypothetical protein JWL84_4011 [Rhodospirillales bacterium]|jgi:hypothetical protein|nr:hypothetical protein [Rhodospirillales bacterium]
MNDPTPAELMRLLRALIASGALRLDLDFKRLDHMDCPVAVEADSNVWIYAGVALCALVFWLGGAWIGLAAAAACLILYLTLGRRYVHRRLRRRIDEAALNDSEIWRRLWRFGGVALVADDGIRCVAPEDNWMALVRARSGV